MQLINESNDSKLPLERRNCTSPSLNTPHTPLTAASNYTVSQKNLCEILIDFPNSVPARLSTKFATKLSLYVLPHLRDIATL